MPLHSILLFGCHMGALAVFLTHKYPQSQISTTDHLNTSLAMTYQTLLANQVGSVNLISDVEIPKDMEQSVQLVYIQIPKGRSLARRWLVQAHRALVKGGNLYIAGSNPAGIQSVIKDGGELYGNGDVLAYKKGNRVARFIKKTESMPEVEWARLPGIAPGSWIEFEIELSNHLFKIRSLPGVFSYDSLDEGTQMLLDAIRIPSDSDVLDVGCGYGIIGMNAAQSGAHLVHLVDNDLLATTACKMTLEINGITNAQVFSGDLLEPVGSNKYNLILSNPPFHTGQAVDYQIAEAMIAQSFQALHPGGRLSLVANRFIRYDRLIQAIFENVAVLAQSGKYHVLSGLKSR